MVKRYDTFSLAAYADQSNTFYPPTDSITRYIWWLIVPPPGGYSIPLTPVVPPQIQKRVDSEAAGSYLKTFSQTLGLSGGVINQGWYRGDQKLVQLIFPVFPLCLQVV